MFSSTTRAFLRVPLASRPPVVPMVRASHSAPPNLPATTIPWESPSASDAWSNPASSDNVKVIKGEDDFKRLLADSSDTSILVVKFHAVFCRACKAIHRRFDRTAAEFSDIGNASTVQFAAVEFDSNRALCQKLGIRTLPHVQVFAGSAGKIADFSIAPLKYETLPTLLNERRQHFGK
ncbi:unnamed protein product [Discosporangium mesarthrocarpum]